MSAGKRLKDGTLAYVDALVVAQSEGLCFVGASTLITLSGTTENDFFLLRNPNASGKNIVVELLSFGNDSSNVRTIIRAYAIPTITANGTAASSVNALLGNATVAVGLVNSQPTISARGTYLFAYVKNAGQDSTQLRRPLTLPPNTSLLFTVQNSTNNTAAHLNVQWYEILL